MDQNLSLIRKFIDILVDKTEPRIISTITNMPIKSHLPFYIVKEILIYYKESCNACNIKSLSKEILDTCFFCKLKYCEYHIFSMYYWSYTIARINGNKNENFHLSCENCFRGPYAKVFNLKNIEKCTNCDSFRGCVNLDNKIYCVDCLHKFKDDDDVLCSLL